MLLLSVLCASSFVYSVNVRSSSFLQADANSLEAADTSNLVTVTDAQEASNDTSNATSTTTTTTTSSNSTSTNETTNKTGADDLIDDDSDGLIITDDDNDKKHDNQDDDNIDDNYDEDDDEEGEEAFEEETNIEELDDSFEIDFEEDPSEGDNTQLWGSTSSFATNKVCSVRVYNHDINNIRRAFIFLSDKSSVYAFNPLTNFTATVVTGLKGITAISVDRIREYLYVADYDSLTSTGSVYKYQLKLNITNATIISLTINTTETTTLYTGG